MRAGQILNALRSVPVEVTSVDLLDSDAVPGGRNTTLFKTRVGNILVIFDHERDNTKDCREKCRKVLDSMSMGVIGIEPGFAKPKKAGGDYGMSGVTPPPKPKPKSKPKSKGGLKSNVKAKEEVTPGVG